MIDRKNIYFTGVDRAGKSSTRKKYAELSRQVNITFDRSPTDNLVYDEVLRGNIYSDQYIKEFLDTFFPSANNYIIFMSLDFKEINRRSKATENIEYSKDELTKTVNCFSRYFNRIKKFKKNITIIRVNCNKKTVDEIAQEIKTKLGE
jgi:thymidylate kinase